MDEVTTLDLVDGADGKLERPSVKPGFLLSLSSRIGAWGLLGGIAVILAPILGASIPISLSLTLGGTGLLIGGFGVGVASSLVLRKTWGTRQVLKYAAMAGIPFGILAAAHGAVVLWFMPWIMEHMQLGDWMTTGAFGFAIALMVLFVAGIVKHFREMPDSEGKST